MCSSFSKICLPRADTVDHPHHPLDYPAPYTLMRSSSGLKVFSLRVDSAVGVPKTSWDFRLHSVGTFHSVWTRTSMSGL